MNERLLLSLMVQLAELQRKDDELNTEFFKLLGKTLWTMNATIRNAVQLLTLPESEERNRLAQDIADSADPEKGLTKQVSKLYQDLVARRQSGSEIREHLLATLQRIADRTPPPEIEGL